MLNKCLENTCEGLLHARISGKYMKFTGWEGRTEKKISRGFRRRDKINVDEKLLVSSQRFFSTGQDNRRKTK
jgi:hypothetical protein